MFRRCQQVKLSHDHFGDATETLWSCQDVELDHVQATGDYFGMNSQNITVDHLDLIGNYVFDGAQNIEVHNSTLVSKDAFWNCENVTIYDSTINGEYLGWNTKNLTLINCTIESDQGLCYVQHLVMKHCRLIKTTLAFEYSSAIDAEIINTIDSVKNPTSGQITAAQIKQLILDPTKIDPKATTITTMQPTTKPVKSC